MLCNVKEYWSANKLYPSRRGRGFDIETPDLEMPEAIKQCQYVMAQVDSNKKSFPVDIWGKPIDPAVYGAMSFGDARALWRDGRHSYYDGFSIALLDQPTPIYLDGIDKALYITAGVYENCVAITGKSAKFSNEFMADWISLGEPTHCFLPSRSGLCWIGLSPQPIVGGIKGDKQIDSANFIVPITDFFINGGNEVSDTWNSPPIKLLPPNAQQIINKILA